MTLKRKDERFYLQPDMHAAVEVRCTMLKISMAAYFEQLVVADMSKWIHETSVAADGLHRAGILRSSPELSGETRKGPK